MTDELPPTLRAAIEEYRQRPQFARRAPLGHPGEICTAKAPDGLVRVVVVTRDFGRYHEILLSHSSPEMATDADAVLRDVTPWPAVFEGDLYGQVWPAQLIEVVGEVDHERLARLRGLLWHPLPEGGPPLHGPVDPRWQFKLDELHQLQRLVGDCRSTLLRECWGEE